MDGKRRTNVLKVKDRSLTMSELNDILLTVNNSSELPGNLFRFYDSLTKDEQVTTLIPVGKGYLQAVTKGNDTGLFRKDLIPAGGEMFLSYEKHSPLFVVMKGEIVVIAPCEIEGA